MKVYVLFYFSKSWGELVGVYSTEERAKEAYDYCMSKMKGSYDWGGLTVCVRILDEPFEDEEET